MTTVNKTNRNIPIRNNYDMLMNIYRVVRAEWDQRRAMEDSTPEELRFLIRLMSEIETWDMERAAGSNLL